MNCTVGNIKCIDRSAFLRADTRENDIGSFLPETGQQIVKEANPIWRLNLDQGVGGMRLVINRDMGWKIELLRELAPAHLRRSLQ